LLIQALSREELTADRDRFAREARTDPLTGLANRAAWDDMLRLENARQERYERPLSVVSADVDGLKRVNDREGHAAGDGLIRAAAEVLQQTARAGDVVARVGGDEFMVLMTEADEAGARRYIRRIRAAALAASTRAGRSVRLSVGAATWRRGEDLATTVSRADRAMYASRRRARREA